MRLKKIATIVTCISIYFSSLTLLVGCNDNHINDDNTNSDNIDTELDDNEYTESVIALTLDNYSDYILLQTQITSFYYTLSYYGSNSYKGDFTRINKINILKLKDVTFEDVIMTIKFNKNACRDENNRLYGWEESSSTLRLAYNGEGYTTITCTGLAIIPKNYNEGDIERMHYAPNEFIVTQISGNVILK